MEREAYEVGNMCFRDWEDSVKSTIYYEHLQKGEKKMSTKDWKNGELTTILSEAFGFKFSLNKLNEGADKNTGMSGVDGDDDDDTYMGHVKEEEELEEGCGDEDNLSEDSGEEEGEHYRDNAMHDEDHIRAIEHHLDALKRDRDYDDIDERASMDDAHPKGAGRKMTKSNGERVTTENTTVSEDLRKAIMEALRKHF